MRQERKRIMNPRSSKTGPARRTPRTMLLIGRANQPTRVRQNPVVATIRPTNATENTREQSRNVMVTFVNQGSFKCIKYSEINQSPCSRSLFSY